ncbi:MAG TPA: tetratricopeptide repeat protein [Myxococcota bacterium]|nr:tetratricopeptide repeat protein [Myxococcota bacterium]
MEAYAGQMSTEILDTIFTLGANFYVQGKYSKAEIIFGGLLALNPDHLNASLALGEVLMMDGQLEKALDHFLTQRDQGIYDGRILLGAAKAYYLLGKYDEAKSMVKPIIEGDIVATKSVAFMAKLMSKN